MYKKILKENASQLTLLALESDNIYCDKINKSLKPFFKNITCISNSDEALWLHKSEKFDLILIDIDTLDTDHHRFINNIYYHDFFQAIAIYSSCIDDSEFIIKLINSQISCFIPKQSKADTMHKILSKVCVKIHERTLLMHYIETLENQQASALDLSCNTKCPMKIELKKIENSKFSQQQTPQPVEEENDFIFFPEPQNIIPFSSEDSSIHQDYFSFLESDDYEKLHDLLGDIDTLLLNSFSDKGNATQSISHLGDSLMGYGNILLHYQFFSEIGTTVLELGKIVSDNAEIIVERSEDFEMLLSGFCSGLQTYMAEVWEKNSDNPKFFNDSIVNDAMTIMAIIQPPQITEDKDDDLLFF